MRMQNGDRSNRQSSLVVTCALLRHSHSGRIKYNLLAQMINPCGPEPKELRDDDEDSEESESDEDMEENEDQDGGGE